MMEDSKQDGRNKPQKEERNNKDQQKSNPVLPPHSLDNCLWDSNLKVVLLPLTCDFFYKAGEDETKGKRKAELLSWLQGCLN